MVPTFIPINRPSQGKLIYVSSDLSFDTVDRQGPGVASILVNDINIEFSENCEAVAIWGLCPSSSWRQGYVVKPMSYSGGIQFQGDLIPGVSIRVTRPSDYWPAIYDSSSGWLYVGQEMAAASQKIEFLAGGIIGLREGQICGLWLRPEFQ